jgi:peptidoglycan/xylan/chitin deacetylase (PgdA/CDA1 family)
VPSLALTFDDGPDERVTPRLLDLLGRAGARATFFPIAPCAAAHPGLITRMLSEGHTVGLHCDQHVRYSLHDEAWCARDADRALSRLHALGAAPALWRTPWGDTPAWVESVAGHRGLRLVGWTADSHDWRGDSAEEMFAATAASLTEGAVVLAHDGIGPGAQRDVGEETVGYAQLVIDHAQRTGLQLEALK